MIQDLRRRIARWRATPAAWIWPLAAVSTLAAVALGLRWWRAQPGTPPTITYSAFLTRLDQDAVRSITVIPGSELRGVWSRAVPDAPVGAAFRVDYPTFEVTPVLERAERAGTPVTLQPRSGFNAEFVREVLEVGRLARDITREADRCADLRRPGLRDLRKPRAQRGRYLVQIGAALLRREARPWPVVEGLARGRDGPVDVARRSLGERHDDFLRDGRDDV
jgi:hypothetical protein